MELGNKAEAKRYINKVRATMEHFATSHYQSGLSQMEVLYKTKKKEAEIEQLTREKRWYLWGGVLTALVLMLTALAFFLLWLGIRLRRRTALVQARVKALGGQLDVFSKPGEGTEVNIKISESLVKPLVIARNFHPFPSGIFIDFQRLTSCCSEKSLENRS